MMRKRREVSDRCRRSEESCSCKQRTQRMHDHGTAWEIEKPVAVFRARSSFAYLHRESVFCFSSHCCVKQ